MLTSFLDGLRFSADNGPLHRSKAARWLAYPLLHPTAADGSPSDRRDAESHEAAEQLPEPWAFLDALKLACALCSEMALGDSVTVASAHHLLVEVLPAGTRSNILKVIY